jgi:cellulose synthase (UDP-forming)
MNKQERFLHIVFTAIALGVITLFGIYWFRLSHIPHDFSGAGQPLNYLLFTLVTYVVWLPIIMKVMLWSIASHIRPRPEIRPEFGLKVAFVTTFVPSSESVSLLHKTLPAMVKTRYPHDTWLLDEGNDPQVIEACMKYGVKRFSRFGREQYNQPDGKYARKTKGGNHNSWYDTVGNGYDIVAQIDTDFMPRSDYLTRTLGYFRDPKVGFVVAPQIYGNTRESFIALGAAQQTYSFYGPLLRGMDGMDTTMLIGANHVIRVAALKDVDHYSAHITEDLLTGMKLHAKGWKSVYVPEVLAIGEGPITWKAYFNQQKRWAYGCMHILFNYSFKLYKKMSMRRIVYYFMIQQFYFTGIAMAISALCLTLYFGLGIKCANLEFKPFIETYVPLIIVLGLMARWMQRFNIRPKKEKGIMYAGMYIGVAAWPIFFMAFLSLFKRKKLVYKVTPKGKVLPKKKSLPLYLFLPHLTLALIMLADFVSSFYTHRNSVVMMFWAVLGTVSLLLVPIIPILLNGLLNIKVTLGKSSPSTGKAQ